jgi:hypothetical protein
MGVISNGHQGTKMTENGIPPLKDGEKEASTPPNSLSFVEQELGLGQPEQKEQGIAEPIKDFEDILS